MTSAAFGLNELLWPPHLSEHGAAHKASQNEMPSGICYHACPNSLPVVPLLWRHQVLLGPVSLC